VNPKMVSERLGHASVVLTLDNYSHVLPNMHTIGNTKRKRAALRLPVTYYKVRLRALLNIQSATFDAAHKIEEECIDGSFNY
jgi:hypothetical protein